MGSRAATAITGGLISRNAVGIDNPDCYGNESFLQKHLDEIRPKEQGLCGK